MVVQASDFGDGNHRFNVGILPRTPWGNEYFFDAHVADTLPQLVTVDAVPVAQQIPRRIIPRKPLHDLLCCPLRCRVLCHVDMDDTPAPVASQATDAKSHTQNNRSPGRKRGRETVCL